MDRKIFKFFDGRLNRGIDPMVAFRGLQDHADYDMETTPALASSGDTQALFVMAQAAKDVFGVAAYSMDQSGQEYGLTEMECVQLLVDFAGFISDLKKNTATGPTSPPPTGSTPSPIESGTCTNASSASGLTSEGPNSEEAGQSLPE